MSQQQNQQNQQQSHDVKESTIRNFEEGSQAYEYLQWMATQTYATADDENEDGRWLALMKTTKDTSKKSNESTNEPANKITP